VVHGDIEVCEPQKARKIEVCYRRWFPEGWFKQIKRRFENLSTGILNLSIVKREEWSTWQRLSLMSSISTSTNAKHRAGSPNKNDGDILRFQDLEESDYRALYSSKLTNSARLDYRIDILYIRWKISSVSARVGLSKRAVRSSLATREFRSTTLRREARPIRSRPMATL
jgi:hypothetical protein